MRVLYGPRMYYSLFGARGLFLGAKAKLLNEHVEVAVAAPGIAHPLFLRLRTTDVELCRQILLDGLYSCEFSRSPQVIVDAGANIGLSSVFYANRYPKAKIIAVEPEPSNHAMLVKNVAAYDNVVAVQAALWKENQRIHVVDPGAGHTAFQTQNWTEGESVRGMTLRQLMIEFDIQYIDLLKIDIEGAEKEVFEHSTPWIGSVGAIAVELHDWLRAGCSESVRQAAKDFEFERLNGEITYLTRSGTQKPNDTTFGNFNSKSPLKILWAL
jgi:FkbM family methyltransferase